MNTYAFIAYVDPTPILLLNGPMGPLALNLGHFGLKLKLWKKKRAYYLVQPTIIDTMPC